MVIKYYGTSMTQHYVGWSATHAVIAKLHATDPYKRTNLHSPSYCVWIVPGTVDANGDDVTFGPVRA